MNFRASGPCYLSCRIWRQNSSPTANVLSMQLEEGWGNGSASSRCWIGRCSTWSKFPDVHWSMSTTKPPHVHVKVTDFFCLFLLQASISEAGELCVRFTFTAMLCAKVTHCLLLCQSNEQRQHFETRIPCVYLTLLFYSSLETWLHWLAHNLFFLGFNN